MNVAYRFPDEQECRRANLAARFHPADLARDPGSKPCMEVAGVVAFLYLDPKLRKVRYSIHLDSTDERLVRPDGTVPIQVDREQGTLDDPYEVYGRLLEAADDTQQDAIRAAAIAASLIWRCRCGWDNPTTWAGSNCGGCNSRRPRKDGA